MADIAQAFDTAKQAQITSAIRMAVVARKSIVHEAVPKYDQLTEFVYQAGVTEDAKGLRVYPAVGKVVPDVIKEAEPIEVVREIAR